MKKTPYLVAVILVGFLVMIKYSEKKATERYIAHFSEFNSANIDTLLEFARIAHKGVEIKLMDGRVFVFYPYTDKVLNDGKIFDHIAKKGDSIQKEPYSKIVILVSNGRTYRYTFKNVDQE